MAGRIVGAGVTWPARIAPDGALGNPLGKVGGQRIGGHVLRSTPLPTRAMRPILRASVAIAECRSTRARSAALNSTGRVVTSGATAVTLGAVVVGIITYKSIYRLR